MSTLKVNAVTDGSGGNTATINSMTPTADSLQGFRNRIINGDMRIAQRSSGSVANSVANSVLVYNTIDRWGYWAQEASKFTVSQSSTAPTGFSNSALITSSTALSVTSSTYYAFSQSIEGFNFADLGFGTANTKSFTVSFWVRSSLTGTFPFYCLNSGYSRSYVSTYTINAANTWEQKTITVSGDTSGTWVGATNGTGIQIGFTLACGSTYFVPSANTWGSTNFGIGISGATNFLATNGATFYITGVQLEVGSVATPFERRDYGTELSRCFRYFQMISSGNNSALPIQFIGQSGGASTAPFGNMPLVSAMRTAPTFVQTASQWRFNSSNGDVNVNGTWTINTGGFEGANYQSINVSFSATASVGAITQARIFTNGGYLGASAEL